jgi:hypothetical protein
MTRTISMSPKRAAAWTVVGALAIAWFASAAGVIGQPWRAPRAAARPAAAQQQGPVSFDVQAQAERLKRRLDTAPTPQPVRNPFVFAERRPRRSARPSPPIAAEPPPVFAPALEAEPPMALIGMAEDGAGDALVRTALIAGSGDELFLVRVGESVGRYRISAITADAVELTDPSTNRVRRLVLR